MTDHSESKSFGQMARLPLYSVLRPPCSSRNSLRQFICGFDEDLIDQWCLTTSDTAIYRRYSAVRVLDTTCLLLLFTQAPMISSDRPCVAARWGTGYISAVSYIRTPPSKAASSRSVAVLVSVLSPKSMVPATSCSLTSYRPAGRCCKPWKQSAQVLRVTQRQLQGRGPQHSRALPTRRVLSKGCGLAVQPQPRGMEPAARHAAWSKHRQRPPHPPTAKRRRTHSERPGRLLAVGRRLAVAQRFTDMSGCGVIFNNLSV